MCYRKTWNVLLTIIALISNGIASKSEGNLNGNTKDSTGFVIHLSTQEILKNEILADIDSKLDQRLEKALQLQRNQIMQDMNLKLEEKLERVLDKLHLRIRQDLTSKSDKLLQDMKQLFEKQQHSKDEHYDKIKKLLEEQQHTNNVQMKQTLEKQQQINDNHMVNSISSQCIWKEKQSRSCAEVMSFYQSNTSGIYDLYLPGMKPFEARCLQDPDNGTPWTIIQRRQDNSTDFYLNWNEYKNGFGNLNTNFFIGLDKIHAMTQLQKHELWIELKDFEGEKRFAKYDAFAIGDESQKYNLNLGAFSGNANNSLLTHNGKKFTTKDNDNDGSDKVNCASLYTGAWWYSTCHDSNLNGRYLNGETSEADKGEGVVWDGWRGSKYSLKYVHMAIRPKK